MDDAREPETHGARPSTDDAAKAPSGPSREDMELAACKLLCRAVDKHVASGAADSPRLLRLLDDALARMPLATWRVRIQLLDIVVAVLRAVRRLASTALVLMSVQLAEDAETVQARLAAITAAVERYQDRLNTGSTINACSCAQDHKRNALRVKCAEAVAAVLALRRTHPACSSAIRANDALQRLAVQLGADSSLDLSAAVRGELQQL